MIITLMLITPFASADDCTSAIEKLKKYKPENAIEQASTAYELNDFKYMAVLYTSAPELIGISYEERKKAIESNSFKIIDKSNGTYCNSNHELAAKQVRLYVNIYNENLHRKINGL